MKKYYSFFATVALAFGMNAQVTMPAIADGEAPENLVTQVVEMQSNNTKAYDLSSIEIKTVKPPHKAQGKRVAAAFPSEWSNFIATYKTGFEGTFGDGGGIVKMKQIGNDIGIGSLFIQGSVFVASATATAGEYEIPSFQVVGNSEEYGDIVVVPFVIKESTSSAGKTTYTLAIDSTATSVKAKATSATSLEIEGLFGYVVKEGEKAGTVFYVANGAKIIPSNAKMTWKKPNDNTEYWTLVNVTQNDHNLSITNFGGGGLEISMPMSSRKVVKIGGNTMFYQNVLNKFRAFTIAGVEYYNPASEKVYLYNTSLNAVADGDKALAWGPWSAYYSSYTVGVLTEGRIECDNAIAWPAPAQAEGLKGTGTENDPYRIENVADWKAVAAASHSGVTFQDQFVKVVADLDFSNDSVPAIGSNTTPFYGTFDGGNHTIIANLTTSEKHQGLIGVLGGGVVKNINVTGEFSFASTNSGPVVGTAQANSTIENCTSTAHVTLGASCQACGGVIGYANFKSTVRNCHFAGVMDINSVMTSSWIAGVCGYGYATNFYNCSNKGTMNVAEPSKVDCVSGINAYTFFSDYENCENTADITANKWVAGISGYAHTVGTSNAKNCVNRGNITTTAASGSYATAGVFGYTMYGGTYENCVNYGNVTSNGETPYVAGVFANYRGSADLGYIHVKNCHNHGDITCAGGNYVGGIIGFGYGSDIESCTNTGTIHSNGAAYNKGTSTGGIVGQFQSFAADTTFYKNKISKCINYGEVKSNSYWVGGIVGGFNTHNIIEQCLNVGNVSAVNRAAGIVGYNPYDSHVKECFNVGNITTTAETAGIGAKDNNAASGIVAYGATDVFDSYNAGKVTGRSRVAGVMAWPYHSTAKTLKDHINYTPSVRNCFNTGEIVADADSCGHILGVHTYNNGTMWRPKGTPMSETELYQYNDTIENTMYLLGMCQGAITAEPTNPEVGYSARELCLQVPSDKFVSAGAYCFPVLKAFQDNDYAKMYAVAVVPAENESDPEIITQDFNIGHPEGVEMYCDYAGLEIEGNKATFNGDPFTGEITITIIPSSALQAKKKANGEGNKVHERKIVINVNYLGGKTGVNDVNASKDVKSVRYYNLNGAQILEPAGACIQITEYTDGTQQAAKVIK
ncbi:MAG: hypothetical protein Q4B68_00830 [Bacteroidales bacterium]|nr:hypothetical protein [Bacteroidales bacterium]